METVSRTVRFKSSEIELIDQFLKENAFFDFSSLTRVAVTQFVQNPNLKIVAVIKDSQKENTTYQKTGRA